jgi:hypothetical protein
MSSEYKASFSFVLFWWWSLFTYPLCKALSLYARKFIRTMPCSSPWDYVVLRGRAQAARFVMDYIQSLPIRWTG